MKEKNYMYKWILIISLIFIILFQSSSLAVSQTNAEIKQAKIQAERLSELDTYLKKEGGYYLIEDAYDLYILARELNNYSTDTSTLYFKQTANIDMLELKEKDKEFYGIGWSSNPFKGHYYGQNYQIKNLSVTNDNKAMGLFGTVKNAYISKVIIASGEINFTQNRNVGALVGNVADKGTGYTRILGCQNLGCNVNATSSGKSAGGLIGCVTSSSGKARVYDCLNMADVTNNASGAVTAGGIIGYCDRLWYIRNCMNTGTITAGNEDGGNSYSYAGGIIGRNYSSSARYCLNKGSIYAYADKQPLDPAYFDTPAMTKAVSGSDTNDNYMLFIEGENVINRSYRNAYAGGICGIFDGSDYQCNCNNNDECNHCATNCINLAYTISGGSHFTESKIVFYVGMNAAITASEEQHIGEKHSIHMAESVFYATDIGYTTGLTFNNCYSKYEDKARSTYLSFSFRSQTYGATVNSSIGSVVPAFSGGKTVGSWYTNKGVTKSAFYSTSDGLYLNKSGLNNLQIRSVTTGGGDCPTNKPGFYNNKIEASTKIENGSRQFYVNYEFYWAKYKAASIFNWSEDYETHSSTRQIEYVTLQPLPKTAYYMSESGNLGYLSSSYFALDSSINNGYPYLKTFYWSDNAVKPS